MNNEKIVKVIMQVSLNIGLVFLAIGIMDSFMKSDIIPNNRVVIGLSFIPLSVAFFYYIKLLRIKKSSQKMHNNITNDNNEKLRTLKNEADATALKITQGALLLTYIGYTFLSPEEIFQSIGWWLLLIVLFVSYMSQGILFSKAIIRKEKADKD
jgi:predicted membrane chloride channel (bestrophin family)